VINPTIENAPKQQLLQSKYSLLGQHRAAWAE